MINRALIAKLNLKDPAVWLATWGGCGLIARAPGTWGTLGALPPGLALLYFGGWPLLAIATVIVFYLGYLAAQRFETMTGTHDNGAIVVDEVAGFWLALCVAPLDPVAIVTAFVLFRFFDIVKPWPVSRFDKMPGAFGVMADDVMAGIYTALCIGGARYAGLV